MTGVIIFLVGHPSSGCARESAVDCSMATDKTAEVKEQTRTKEASVITLISRTLRKNHHMTLLSQDFAIGQIYRRFGSRARDAGTQLALRKSRLGILKDNNLRCVELPPLFDGFTIHHISDTHVDMNQGGMQRHTELVAGLQVRRKSPCIAFDAIADCISTAHRGCAKRTAHEI